MTDNNNKMGEQQNLKKISMSSGTESVLWHMMNDMHRVTITSKEEPMPNNNEKAVNDLESALRDGVNQEQLLKRKTLKSRIRIAVGIVLILLVLFLTIFVSEMKKHHP
ncbi:hypothetical protein BDC45DRAFT_607187 [Circinella umbellata]|nr:hypothetical protein BDC45DRAFT_607187 [Circinella umbellata]